MGNGRDYCFRHSRMYEGWQCPLCLEEEQKGTAKPADVSAGPGAARAAGAGGAHATEPAHQVPSRAESAVKSKQAEAVLVSGAARDALDLCEAAIGLDPRNIQAYLIGARASRVMRDAGLEQEMLEAAIKLLKTEEYGRNSQAYVEVLRHLRDGRMVSQLAEVFAKSQQWPPAEALSMLKALVGRGATREALVVIDNLPAGSRSLLTCAYSMQLSASPLQGVDPDLARYVKSIDAAERARLLAEFYEVRASEVLAHATVVKLRDAVRARYMEWKSEIKQDLSEEARKAAAERIAPQLGSPAMSSAVRFFVGGLVVATVLVLLTGAGVLGFVVGIVLALGAGGAGMAYGRDVELKRLLPTVLPAVKEELTNREAERWAPILSDEPLTRHEPEETAAPEPPSEPCPYCASPVPTGASACPHCQKPMPTPEPGAAPGPEPEPEK
jgi:hypothetical protein